jgi:hypothetical protein
MLSIRLAGTGQADHRHPLWDPWFVVWGLLLAAATWGYRRSARQVKYPAA